MGRNPGESIAHLGGAFLGYVYITQRRRGVDLAAPFTNVWKAVSGLFRPKPRKAKVRVVSSVQRRVEVRTSTRSSAGGTYTASEPTRDTDSSDPLMPTQEEIDRILEKIQEQGYDKLTKAEKQALYLFGQK
jgi:hypothetical protein